MKNTSNHIIAANRTDKLHIIYIRLLANQQKYDGFPATLREATELCDMSVTAFRYALMQLFSANLVELLVKRGKTGRPFIAQYRMIVHDAASAKRMISDKKNRTTNKAVFNVGYALSGLNTYLDNLLKASNEDKGVFKWDSKQ